VTPDPKLVEAIYRDRSPYGQNREDAERASARYEAWLMDLEYPPVLTDQGRRTLNHVLDRCLLRPGRGAALFAAQGKGKTNVLAVITQLVLRYRPEWDVFTNVPYPWWAGGGKAPPRLNLIGSLSDLLAGLSRRTLQGKWSAVIIDEFDQVDTSHSWASTGSESWAKFLFVARHYMTRGPLVVFHSFHFIPLTIRGGSVGSPFKLLVRKGERVIADLENPDGAWVGTYPESDLPFLTFGLRGFRIDVDVQELESRFTGPKFAGDVTAVARATLQFLKETRDRPSYRDALAQRKEILALAHGSNTEKDWAIARDLAAGLSWRQAAEKHHVSFERVSRTASLVPHIADSDATGYGATTARARRARGRDQDSSGGSGRTSGRGKRRRPGS